MLLDPVTLAITRVPKLGREREWEEVMGEIQRATRGFPGSLGTTVLKPVPGGKPAYRIFVRFDSLANFQLWESSPERQHFLTRLQSLETEPVQIAQATGLETWFEFPDDVPMVQPPRYKMIIASTLGVYLTITPLLYVLGPLLKGMPLYASTAVIVPITVVLLSYVTMPLVTRWLKPWLHAARGR